MWLCAGCRGNEGRGHACGSHGFAAVGLHPKASPHPFKLFRLWSARHSHVILHRFLSVIPSILLSSRYVSSPFSSEPPPPLLQFCFLFIDKPRWGLTPTPPSVASRLFALYHPRISGGGGLLSTHVSRVLSRLHHPVHFLFLATSFGS